MGRKFKRNPRVAVTLSPEANELVCRLTKISKLPKSRVLADLIDSVIPALVQLEKAFEQVEEAPREAQRILARMAMEATVELGQAQLDLDNSLNAGSVKGERAKRAKGATHGTP